MFIAWHVAAFNRSKRMPKLRRLLDRMLGKKRKRSSWQEQLKMVEALNQQFGGTDKRKGIN